VFSKKADTSPAPAATASVPLVMFRDASLVGYSGIPVTTGIPIPDGMLDDASQVSLLENGREIPCQTIARSRWTRKGTIRWLGLDFQAAYDNGEPRKYELQIGKPASAKHPKPVTVEQTPEAFTLSNGVLKATIGRKSFRLFDRVVFDRNADGKFADDDLELFADVVANSEVMVQAAPTDGPYWVNAAGKVFRAAHDSAPDVRIEEAGALRTTIRADGWLVAEDGEKAGRYTTRISVWAGRAQIGVNQTYVITWDTLDRNMRVKDMGIAVSPVKLEKTLHSPYLPPLDIPETGTISMLCDRWNRLVYRDTGSDKVIGSGHAPRYDVTNWLNNRFPIWHGGFGPNGGIAVGQRYLAEKFPKEIQAGAKSLSWHAWPANGTETMLGGTDIQNFVNMHWLHQGDLLDFQIPDEYFKAVEGFRAIDKSRVTLLMYKDRNFYGSGTTISGELMYYFAPETADHVKFWNQVMPAAYQFDAAPHAIADPHWAKQTQVLEWLTPVAPQYPDIERGISRYFDSTMAIIEDNREYGQFIWPNGHDYYTPGGSFSSLHRSRVNTHHGTEIPGWILYLRSGEKKYWHYARSFSRYLLDHASMSWDPYDPKVDGKPERGIWPGSVFHCQGYVPWSIGEPELLGHMSPQWHAVLYYYMTGDSQTLDFAKAAATSVLKSVRTPEDFRVREPYGGKHNRNPLCGWGMVVSLYTEFHDPRLLRPVFDIGRQIFDGKPIEFDGAPPHGQSGKWWWYDYTRQWRDPVAIDTVCNISPNGGTSFAGYMMDTHKYTGNPQGIYAFWLETLGLGPIRQFGMGHPEKFVNREPHSDNTNFLVPLINAMVELNLPEVPCLLPMGYDTNCYTVFFEDEDRPFTIRFWGPVYEGPEDAAKYKPIPYILEGPDGKPAAQGEINRKALGGRPDKGVEVKIPADGKTGQYTLRFADSGMSVQLVAPLSDLPKEVYVIPAGRSLTGTAYYWRTAPDERHRTLSQPIKMGENYSTLFRLETPEGYTVAESASILPIHLTVKPDTMYRLTMCVASQTSYAWRWKGVWPAGGTTGPARGGVDMVLAAEESRWFRPSARP